MPVIIYIAQTSLLKSDTHEKAERKFNGWLISEDFAKEVIPVNTMLLSNFRPIMKEQAVCRPVALSLRDGRGAGEITKQQAIDYIEAHNPKALLPYIVCGFIPEFEMLRSHTLEPLPAENVPQATP